MARSSKKTAKRLLAILQLLKRQTLQKLKGERHIKNRIVSLDELHARPIKKGKQHPKCEFGSTHQMTFNRQGFMITSQVLIGAPNDKTLYAKTLELFSKRMKQKPKRSITDQGYRSGANFKKATDIEVVYFGKSNDVAEEQRKYCQSARSATEGVIAIAKNRRGFDKSLYRGIKGDHIWAALSQIAYNLKKLLQLFLKEELEEETLIKLRIFP